MAQDKTPAATTQKTEPNWAQAEIDYRAGLKPLRQIGKECGVSHVAIQNRAKKDGWTRDLKAAIVAKAEEKVTKAALTSTLTTDRVVTEKAVVEANAELQYQVRMRHRGDIASLRSLFVTLLQELKASSTPDGVDLLESMHEVVHGASDPEDKDGSRRAEKMREALSRALSGSTRVGSAKQLTEMLEKLIKLERQAFGIEDEEGGAAGDLEKILAKIHGERGG